MRATHTIESIFGTRGRTLVLRVLHGVQVPLQAAQVGRYAGLTRPAAAASLDELERIGLVGSSRVGRATAYWLIRENIYVERIVEPVFVAVENMGEELERELRDAFASLCVSVVVFGSYARDQQEPSSDVDVVLVAADPAAKHVVEEATLAESARFYRRWGTTLSPLVYDLAYAANLHETSAGLYGEIERDGVVVSGLWPYEWSKRAPK
jgi:predicted nucleotidyltransferase